MSKLSNIAVTGVIVAVILLGAILLIDDHRKISVKADAIVGKSILLEGAAHPAHFTTSEIIVLNSFPLLSRNIRVKGVLEVQIPSKATFLGSSRAQGEIIVNMFSAETGSGETWIFPTEFSSPEIPMTIYIEPTDIRVIAAKQ